MKIISGKARFEENDYELAYEMSENGYPIFINNIGAFGGDCGKVTGMHPRFANNYGDDYEDESENPELADQIVCINKFIGQSSLNWGEWSELYMDAWTPAEEYENWVERENMKKPKENESFSFKKTKMNLNEAKHILKKNGYIVESIEPEEMFLNKVKLELLNDSNFIKMFNEDEIDSYIEKFYDGLTEYMNEDPESYVMAASWLKEMIYEE